MDAVSRLPAPMPRLRLSRIPDLECQQNVAGQTAPLRVARIDVQHAIDDDRPGPVHGATMGQNAIHRCVFARRVDLPKQPRIVRRISANSR